MHIVNYIKENIPSQYIFQSVKEIIQLIRLNEFTVQGVASWVYILMLVSPLSLYATLVAVCCSQLEKIQTGILNVRQEEEEPAWTTQSRLAACVDHHQKVIR